MATTLSTSLNDSVNQNYGLGKIISFTRLNLKKTSKEFYLIQTDNCYNYLLKSLDTELSISQFIFQEFCLKYIISLSPQFVSRSLETKTGQLFISHDQKNYNLRPYFKSYKSIDKTTPNLISKSGSILAKFHCLSQRIPIDVVFNETKAYLTKFNLTEKNDIVSKQLLWTNLVQDYNYNLNQYLDKIKYQQKIKKSKIYPSDLIPKLKFIDTRASQITLSALNLVKRNNNIFIHGDFHLKNILKYKQNNNDLKLIDFEFAHLSAPCFDLAYAILMSASNWYLNPLSCDSSLNDKTINNFLYGYTHYFKSLNKSEVISNIKSQLLIFLKLTTIINLNWCLKEYITSVSKIAINEIQLTHQICHLCKIFLAVDNLEVLPKSWL